MSSAPIFSGSGFSARRTGSARDAVRFHIEAREWDGETEAACRVRIEEAGEVLVDREIFGLDPLQALECAVQLVRRFAVMVEPDNEYVAELTR